MCTKQLKHRSIVLDSLKLKLRFLTQKNWQRFHYYMILLIRNGKLSWLNSFDTINTWMNGLLSIAYYGFLWHPSFDKAPKRPGFDSLKLHFPLMTMKHSKRFVFDRFMMLVTLINKNQLLIEFRYEVGIYQTEEYKWVRAFFSEKIHSVRGWTHWIFTHRNFFSFSKTMSHTTKLLFSTLINGVVTCILSYFECRKSSGFLLCEFSFDSVVFSLRSNTFISSYWAEHSHKLNNNSLCFVKIDFFFFYFHHFVVSLFIYSRYLVLNNLLFCYMFMFYNVRYKNSFLCIFFLKFSSPYRRNFSQFSRSSLFYLDTKYSMTNSFQTSNSSTINTLSSNVSFARFKCDLLPLIIALNRK